MVKKRVCQSKQPKKREIVVRMKIGIASYLNQINLGEGTCPFANKTLLTKLPCIPVIGQSMQNEGLLLLSSSR